MGLGRTGWRGGLGSIGALGPGPGSRPPDRVRGRLGQALRGDDGGWSTLVEDCLEFGEVAVVGVAGALDDQSMGTGTWGRWARVGLEMGSGGEGETGLGGLGRRGRGGWGATSTGRPLTPGSSPGQAPTLSPRRGIKAAGMAGRWGTARRNWGRACGRGGWGAISDWESGAGSNPLPQERD